MSAYEVIVRGEFAAAHALRHYHGETEPLHGHNFQVEVVVRGKRLQNKVKYLVDFVALQKKLDRILKLLDHANLNDLPPFKKENPSAENLAVHIGRALTQSWQFPGVRLASVTVWETSQTAARYLP